MPSCLDLSKGSVTAASGVGGCAGQIHSLQLGPLGLGQVDPVPNLSECFGQVLAKVLKSQHLFQGEY